MRLRDPRGNKTPGINTTNDQTGTQSMDGLLDVQGIDLGNGCGAIATINVTRTPSTAGPFTTSSQLMAADATRLALTIVNTDPVKILYLGLNGATATVGGTPAVAPNGVYNVDPSVVQGQVNARWQNSATQGASMLATTA